MRKEKRSWEEDKLDYFFVQLSCENQVVGTFESQVLVYKRSDIGYKELSSWMGAVYKSKQESKTRDFRRFQQGIPIANDRDLRQLRQTASALIIREVSHKIWRRLYGAYLLSCGGL